MSAVKRDEKEIIAIALSIIYKASNKGVESCTFEGQKVKLIYKDKSLTEFDLNDNIDDDQKSKLMRYVVRTIYSILLSIYFLNHFLFIMHTF